MQYTIRQATIKDLDILDNIHTENMKKYVEKVYPWNPQLFRERFKPQDYQVIEIKKRVIGLLKVVESENTIYLAEIQIASSYQQKGIGTSLIKSLIQKAQTNHKQLWLKVVRGNPAERLYARLGFRTFAESATHKKMMR